MNTSAHFQGVGIFLFLPHFLLLSLYFCDGLPIFRALLQPDDDRTSLVMVSHNNCNHPTCAQCVVSFVIFLSFLRWGADFHVSCGFALQTANSANTNNMIFEGRVVENIYWTGVL